MSSYHEHMQQLWKELSSYNYCILRNHDFLQKSKPYDGKDIDMLVAEQDIAKLMDSCKKLGYKQVRSFAPQFKVLIFLLNNQVISLHVHSKHPYRSNTPMLDGTRVLQNRQEKSGTYIASTEDELAILLLKTLGSESKKYDEKIKELRKIADTKKLTQTLQFPFGDKSASIAHRVKKRQTIHTYKNNWIKRRKQSVFLFQVKQILCAIGKPAPVITLIGMDGAGKSTLTEGIIAATNNSLLKVHIEYSGKGRNNVLPIQKVGKKVQKNLEKKPSQSRKKIMHTLGAFAFSADMALRYWKRIYPKRLTHHLIITDRFTSDILLSKYVPQWITRTLYVFLPKSSHVIYLYNDPQVLFERKGHPLEDLKRQAKLFARITKVTRAFKIKSDTVEKTKTQALNYIWKQLK